MKKQKSDILVYPNEDNLADDKATAVEPLHDLNVSDLKIEDPTESEDPLNVSSVTVLKVGENLTSELAILD